MNTYLGAKTKSFKLHNFSKTDYSIHWKPLSGTYPELRVVRVLCKRFFIKMRTKGAFQNF